VTVAVGHRSSLVTAGLALTVPRTPGCTIRLSTIPSTACAPDCPKSAQLVFGDAALLHHLHQSADGCSPCALASARFVLVTACDEERAHEAEIAGDIDAHLPVDCAEHDVFALVRRLSGNGDGSPQAELRRTSFRGGLPPGAFRRVCEYIDARIAQKISVGALARIAALSLGHFRRAFAQTTGVPPHRYIVQKRIAAASELLRNSARALADIALEVGFADQSHFTRTYAAYTGETPSAFRRRHR
jgi:AraC-like DNA-binding protein